MSTRPRASLILLNKVSDLTFSASDKILSINNNVLCLILTYSGLIFIYFDGYFLQKDTFVKDSIKRKDTTTENCPPHPPPTLEGLSFFIHKWFLCLWYHLIHLSIYCGKLICGSSKLYSAIFIKELFKSDDSSYFARCSIF